MSYGFQHDLGAFVHVVPAGTTSTAKCMNGHWASSSTEAVTAVTSAEIDVAALPRDFLSCVVSGTVQASLASGIVYRIDVAVQSATATGGSYSAIGSTGIVATLTGATGGSTYSETVVAYKRSVDLAALGAGMKVVVTPSWLATSSGDTVIVGQPVVVLGGADRLPASG